MLSLIFNLTPLTVSQSRVWQCLLVSQLLFPGICAFFPFLITYILIINHFFSTYPAAKGVCLLRGRSIHVGVCHPLAVHQPLQVQPLYCVTGASRHRRLVPQVPSAVPERFCQVYQACELYSSRTVVPNWWSDVLYELNVK